MNFIKYIFSIICGLHLLSNASLAVTFNEALFSINEQDIYTYVANKHLSTFSGQPPYGLKDLESYLRKQELEGAQNNVELHGIIAQWQEDTKDLDLAQQTKLQKIFLHNIALKYFALGVPVSELALIYPSLTQKYGVLSGIKYWFSGYFLNSIILEGIKDLITDKIPFSANGFNVSLAANPKIFLENISNEDSRWLLAKEIKTFASNYHPQSSLMPKESFNYSDNCAILEFLELTNKQAQAVREKVNSLPITFKEINSKHL